MNELQKFFIAIFAIVSIILIVFFCPVEVNVTNYNKTSIYDTNSPTFYTYDDNRPLWDMGGSSTTSYLGVRSTGTGYIGTNPYVSSTKTVEINWGKLFLEELCVAGVIFVLYMTVKRIRNK